MHFQATDQIPFEQLHASMLDAYSDYVVPMNLSLEQFTSMTRERCYNPERSLAALDGDRIAAFWLIGENERIEALTLYAISVGTTQDYRRRGLSSALFDAIRQGTDTANFKQMVLEVITRNARAYAAYQKMGFKLRRRVQLSRGKFHGFEPPTGNMQVREVSLEEARSISDELGDWKPTWQNSLGSMEQDPKEALCLAVDKGPTTVGLGCFIRSSGQIKQLAAQKGVSRREVATLLLATAGRGRDDNIRHYVNIDESDNEILGLLAEQGWEHYIDQFEMVCPLT